MIMITVSFFAAPAFTVSAQVKTADTKTNVTTETKLIDTQKVEDASADAVAKSKNWFTGVYQKIDAWRVQQATIWTAIKTEKETEITVRTQTVNDHRDDRVNRILNEEQITLFNGAGEDLKGDGNIFLLRLYAFALSIFVIIFTTPVIFYGIIIIVLLSIVHKIFQRVRNPHAY